MTNQTSHLHVIFGAGPVGRAIMTELIKQGEAVRIINRSGGAFPDGVENVRGDVLEGDFAIRASEGATHIYFALNPEYTQWLTYFQPMQDAVLAAAEAHNAKLTMMENVYGYGDTQGKPMTEDTPFHAQSRKGKLRAQMSAQLLAAHQAGRVQVTMGRASDFYGAGVHESAMGERALMPLVKGEAAEYRGALDARHSQTYMPDIGRALVTLALDERAYGRAWHIPNAPAITQRQFLDKAFAAAGHAPQYKPLPEWLMTVAGLFVPILRELKEVQYQFKQDFVVDSSAFEETFGWSATPIDEGIAATVAWYQGQVAQPKGA